MTAIAVFVLPVLLTRGRIAGGANLVAAVSLLLLVLGLSHSAMTPPNECATNSGTYEDHASGIPEFEMLSRVLFYMVFAVDTVAWLVRIVRRTTSPSATPPTG